MIGMAKPKDLHPMSDKSARVMIAIGTELPKRDSWRIRVPPCWTISRLETPTKRRMSQSISWPHVPFSFFRYASGICWYFGIQDLWFSLGKDHLLASNAACRQTQAVKTMRGLALVSSTIFGRAVRALLHTGRQGHWIIPPVHNGVPKKKKQIQPVEHIMVFPSLPQAKATFTFRPRHAAFTARCETWGFSGCGRPWACWKTRKFHHLSVGNDRMWH